MLSPSADIRRNYGPLKSGSSGRFLSQLLEFKVPVPLQKVDMGDLDDADPMIRIKAVSR